MCITPKNSQKTGLMCGSTLPPKANPSTELAKGPGLVQYFRPAKLYYKIAKKVKEGGK